MSEFFDANYTVTKLKKKLGKITELEINHKPVSIGSDLKAFKYTDPDTSAEKFLYSTNIPNEDTVNVDIYTTAKTGYTGAIIKDKANFFTDHADTECWIPQISLTSLCYDENCNKISRPIGLVRESDILFRVVLYGSKIYRLVEPEDDPEEYYEISKLGATEAECVISDTAVTDETLIAHLLDATHCILRYDIIGIDEGFTYDDEHYVRDSEYDITLV